MKEFTIDIHNLSIGYKEKKYEKIIAHSINTSIYAGQFISLIGPNGSGKTTLLRTLSSFLCPLCGEIIIGGKKISFYSNKNLAKIISIVLTEKINVHNMSVYELMSIGRSPYTGFFGKLKKEDEFFIKEILQLIQITNLINKNVQILSDGEKQKIMLAKALVQQTPIIFLDEPTSFLDMPSKIEIFKILKKISKTKQKTILLSTHDINIALQVSDKIWLMSKGESPIIKNINELPENWDIKNFTKLK